MVLANGLLVGLAGDRIAREFIALEFDVNDSQWLHESLLRPIDDRWAADDRRRCERRWPDS